MRAHRVCVYCGSRSGSDEFVDAARAFANALADRGWDLVYGGGNVGLMGVVADTVMARGREVTGVIPHSLFDVEVAHRGITELLEVESMHERKAVMAARADAFVALPGGLGTLEELFEAVTWHQIGIHAKPCGILNAFGFYDSLLEFLHGSADAGFVSRGHLERIIVADEPGELLDALAERFAD
ncbi:MAG: TIGR00730 family Rossman fold protein [Planctomycetes bacterium]|nr:TIGR00730 family Rossman fold protein [Planctomycetota bacterium]